ncbi:hypothetical protein VTI74DRAFT_2827 [Chaetomium olivicolor]
MRRRRLPPGPGVDGAWPGSRAVMLPKACRAVQPHVGLPLGAGLSVCKYRFRDLSYMMFFNS